MIAKILGCGVLLATASLAGAQEHAQAVMMKHSADDKAAFEAQMAVHARVPLESKTITGAPFSAEIVSESVQVLADGNRIVRRSTGRVYRDSQGRTRREDDLEPGRAGSISITDPVEKASYVLDTASKIAWATPSATAGVLARKIAPGEPADPADVELRRRLEAELVAAKAEFAHQSAEAGSLKRRSPQPPWDETTEVLPARQIEGVVAEGTRITRRIPAGAIGNEQPIVTVTEEWRSPELQVLVLTRTSDPRTGETTYRLTNITRAEPGPSWFDVPADYTVRQTDVRRAPAMSDKR